MSDDVMRQMKYGSEIHWLKIGRRGPVPSDKSGSREAAARDEEKEGVARAAAAVALAALAAAMAEATVAEERAMAGWGVAREAPHAARPVCAAPVRFGAWYSTGRVVR